MGSKAMTERGLEWIVVLTAPRSWPPQRSKDNNGMRKGEARGD